MPSSFTRSLNATKIPAPLTKKEKLKSKSISDLDDLGAVGHRRQDDGDRGPQLLPPGIRLRRGGLGRLLKYVHNEDVSCSIHHSILSVWYLPCFQLSVHSSQGRTSWLK